MIEQKNQQQKEKNEPPPWSVKRQKAYKISRILWIVQIAFALIVSICLGLYIIYI